MALNWWVSLKDKRWFCLSTILFVLSIRDNWHQAWRYAFTSLKTSKQRACSPPLVAFTLVLESFCVWLMASFRCNEPLWQILHFPFCCTIDHWISGKVWAACNSIIKNTSLRIQKRTMSDESWWLGWSRPEGEEGLVLPPHSSPPPATFEATITSPWSQHRTTKSRHWVLLGEHNVRVCYIFFQVLMFRNSLFA